MGSIVQDLIDHLTLETLDTNLFRGQSVYIGTNRVFGGQVLAQALAAAAMTVDEGDTHSLHAYFLRPGDPAAPIIYEVDRARDGRSYASRRVVAIQHGHQILNLAASFHRPETGFAHQAPMPDVPRPETLKDIAAWRREFMERLPDVPAPRFMMDDGPFDFRMVQPPPHLDPDGGDPVAMVWFRAIERLPDDPALHRTMLTYASDYSLIGTATRPHRIDRTKQYFSMTSLDHAMWFQRPFRVDEWLLYACESPTATNGRCLVQGRIYREDGVLAAVVMQEGVMRVVDRRARDSAAK
ncbi:MAG: acyl-CoA thioesterase II [Gemmatimonadales bacterium]|nr:acyl-CoA thioesterase II [Gemmatimonadales bacterium]